MNPGPRPAKSLTEQLCQGPGKIIQQSEIIWGVIKKSCKGLVYIFVLEISLATNEKRSYTSLKAFCVGSETFQQQKP